MRFDIEIKYKNNRSLGVDHFVKFERKGGYIVYDFADGTRCMDKIDDILSIEITKVEEDEEYGKLYCR